MPVSASCRVILLAVVVVALAAAPTAGFEGAPWFEPGKPYDQNFPDPAIIEVDGTYHAYSTITGGSAMPVMTSTDLETWIAWGDALGTGPPWSPVDDAGHPRVWAPSVVELPDGSFMAAYAAPTGAGERFCIATAHAGSPTGPFVTAGDSWFVCEDDPNGAIDPFLVVDESDVPWLIWKNEGVPVGHPTLASRRTAIWSRQLTDDGRAWRPGSAEHFLIETTERQRPWQGTLIENPALVRFEGQWLLFYSANLWDSEHYAVGYAICEGPAGPCQEPSVDPLLVSDDERLGPGAPAPIVGPDGWLRLGYQAWDPPHTNYPDSQRRLHMDHLCVAGAEIEVWDDDGRAFCDVVLGEWYSEAVAWLAETGVTTGVTPTVYGFDLAVTRAQMATFLWRLMGEPVAGSPAPFADVDPGRFFGEAVAWLAGAGITTGVAPDRFDPDGTVTRAQMATFLWRLVGEPVAGSPAPFVDVDPGRFYVEAVAWLAESGITTGVAPDRFDPDGTVTRAQMATFLCRLSGTSDYAATGAPTPTC